MTNCCYFGRETKNFNGNVSYFVSFGIPCDSQRDSLSVGYKSVRLKVDEEHFSFFDKLKIFDIFTCEIVTSTRSAFVNWEAFRLNGVRDVESIAVVRIFELKKANS